MVVPDDSPAVATTASNGWTPAEGEVRYLTVRMSVKCEHCGQPVPVNGPFKRVKCGACLETSSTHGLVETLNEARKGYRVMGSRFEFRSSDHPNPECFGCGKRVQFEELLTQHGATTTHPCQECDRPSVTYPVPKWLAGQFHGALQIFGGDPPEQESARGAKLEIPEETPEPVAMACPSCSGGLTIGVEAERTTKCEYCGVNVFIPDALWKILHPAKTQEFWTISFLAKKKKEPKKPPPNAPEPKAAPSSPPEPAEATTASPQPGSGRLYVFLGMASILIALLSLYILMG